MQAIVCREHGGPEVMKCEEIVQPEPAAREVLIKADAIGVNYVDIMYWQQPVTLAEVIMFSKHLA